MHRPKFQKIIFHESQQFIEAAKNGNLAEVDRFVKSGVAKEGKDQVRVVTNIITVVIPVG